MSSDPSSDLPCRTGSFRAVVRVGATVTEYSRAGSGRPVVLLGRFDSVCCSRSAIQEALSGRFKVVVPETEAPTGDFAAWLRAFLDGLGLTRVDLVADDGHGVPAIGFALLEPDRVDRLILLSGCGEAGVSVDADLGDPVRRSAHQLLLIRLDQPVDDITQQVVQFLLGDPATTA